MNRFNLSEDITGFIDHISTIPDIAQVQFVEVRIDRRRKIPVQVFYKATAYDFHQASRRLDLNEFRTVSCPDPYGHEGNSLFNHSGHSVIIDGTEYDCEIALELSKL